jgi:hypothetical protein
MHHFLREDDAAVRDLQLVKSTKYAVAGLAPDREANGERYLNNLSDEYPELIRLKKYPRDGQRAEPAK